jgi:pimeloyl-ACP methyl ester carboxylesterase
VLHRATAPGTSTVVPAARKVAHAKVVDGGITDWRGVGAGYGGTVVRSAGELVYTDHLFDAFGADDGKDAKRLARIEAVSGPIPEGYRLEPVFTSNVAGELGAPPTKLLSADERYGNTDRNGVADLLEARLSVDAASLYVLARTTNMHTADDTAVVVLVDTVPGTAAHAVPFGSGITTTTADVAVLLANGKGEVVNLATGARVLVPVAVDPSGYTNAIEASIPAAALGRPERWGSAPLRIALASGAFDATRGAFADIPGIDANVSNVAFRTHEPVTTWFEQRQALALYGRSIDSFFVDVAPRALLAGANEIWKPGPGYHDRIFTSSEAISSEGGSEGVHQHYGVHLPPGYNASTPPASLPMTLWLHWRGGRAHSAATVSPRIMRDLGDAVGGIVIAPRGRGSSSWYLGKGLADVNEVWDDAFARFPIDPDRVHVSGHSMGGWGSYLLSILYPDRFAGAFPVSGPVTQGAWTGVDFDGCDDYVYDEYTPCYIGTNDSDPRLQHTRRLLENLRNVPIAIYQGAADELVPVSGVTRQVQRLVELGYRHRYYVFPTYEHYSHPVVDEWADGARYVNSFERNPNPARVTYVRDMPFERSVETGPSRHNPTTGLSFDFDHAYWMSGLTPVDAENGVARFDGTSHSVPAEDSVLVPEAGGPASLGQAGPYAMTGLAWLANPLATAATANDFAVALAGAKAVRLDLARMNLTRARVLTGSVQTDTPLALGLRGGWTVRPVVRVDGVPVKPTLAGGVITFTIPTGAHRVVIT